MEGPERIRLDVPQRWAIWLSIRDDLRFLSHHDTMRAIERTAARAGLPLAYTQGFNPRPILSLACPRPVGVATCDDLLVAALIGPVDATAMLQRLNGASPPGMRFLGAAPLPGKRPPQPRRIDHELSLDPPQARRVARRIDDLQDQPTWPVERPGRPSRRARGKVAAGRTVNLRPLTADVMVEGTSLRWTQLFVEEQTATCRDVLSLLGLDERINSARAIRVGADYRLSDDQRGDFRTAHAPDKT